MPTFPSGTVTVLFTDIDGSTDRWERQPDSMRSALERHDELMRRAVEDQGGYVFKTVGDASCAAFSNAVTGLEAATERDGDYFGQPVNRVARVEAVGNGGQSLLSRESRRLVESEGRLEGCRLRDLG